MGVSHGCEIVSHLVHHELEMDHSKVMIKVDVKNAFNDIDPAAIINVVFINYQLYYHIFCSSLRCPR